MTASAQANPSRKTAIIVGLLFIIGTAAGVASGLVTMRVMDDPNYLAAVAANEGRIALGAFLVLVMGFPLAMIPVVMFPIFRTHNEILALGAVIFRGVLEAVTYIVIALCMLLLIPLSQEFVQAGAADASYFQALSTMLAQASYWTEHILAIVFSLGAMMLYWLFLQTKLVPRWLALWGFVGAVLYFAAPVASIFDPQHLPLSLGVKWGNLMVLLAIQEMVFALWLIIKGFNRSALTSESATPAIKVAH